MASSKCVTTLTRSHGNAMSRRTFGRILVRLWAASPHMATAQATSVVRRIGRLESGNFGTPEENREDGEDLRQLGWVEGRNLHVERRFANGKPAALSGLAEDLVRANVEVIITGGTPATVAAMRATTIIPIVFSAGDPVALGLVRSLARPGGNVTGFSLAGPETEAKQLTVLKELLPTVRHIGVFEPAAHAYFRATREQFERSCLQLALQPVFVEVAAANEIDAAIAQLIRQRAEAVVLRADGFVLDHKAEITSVALKYSVPTMAEQPQLVREASALISYSGLQAEVLRRLASFVDRILRGAKPADLPVEQPTQFELLINLKTAKALGLTIPPTMLVRANEVIR